MPHPSPAHPPRLHHHPRRTPPRARPGQALIEFLFVLPIIAITLFLMLDLIIGMNFAQKAQSLLWFGLRESTYAFDQHTLDSKGVQDQMQAMLGSQTTATVAYHEPFPGLSKWGSPWTSGLGTNWGRDRLVQATGYIWTSWTSYISKPNQNDYTQFYGYDFRHQHGGTDPSPSQPIDPSQIKAMLDQAKQQLTQLQNKQNTDYTPALNAGKVNDYDKDGHLIGSHIDPTYSAALEAAKQAAINYANNPDDSKALTALNNAQAAAVAALPQGADKTAAQSAISQYLTDVRATQSAQNTVNTLQSYYDSATPH